MKILSKEEGRSEKKIPRPELRDYLFTEVELFFDQLIAYFFTRFCRVLNNVIAFCQK